MDIIVTSYSFTCAALVRLFNYTRLLAVFVLRLGQSAPRTELKTPLRWDATQALTAAAAAAAKLIGLYGLGFTRPPQPAVRCLLSRLGHIQERCRCPVTREEHLSRNPRQNCCPEKNFNNKFRFMGPVVLLVYGCYCEEMWFEAVTTPLTPKGLFYQGHGNIKKQITWGLFFFFFLSEEETPQAGLVSWRKHCVSDRFQHPQYSHYFAPSWWRNILEHLFMGFFWRGGHYWEKLTLKLAHWQ